MLKLRRTLRLLEVGLRRAALLFLSIVGFFLRLLRTLLWLRTRLGRTLNILRL